MWEYKRNDVKFRSYSELTEALNNEGRDNWEVIHYSEDKPEKYGSDINAKILLKRYKN